ANPRRLVERAPLRQVADRPVRRARRPSEHRDGAGGQRQQPEDGAQQRGLARAVRAEHRGELALAERQAHVAPDGPAAQAQLRVLQHHRGHAAHPSALSIRRSWRTCQSWNEADAGSGVSLTVTTAMPAERASSVSRFTSGVAFWLLWTQSRICPDEICRSTVLRSEADGSAP